MNASLNATQRRRQLVNNNILSGLETSMLDGERKTKVQAVKREVAQKTRDDWKYKWPGGDAEASSKTDNGTDSAQHEKDQQLDERTVWQERDFSTPYSSPTSTISDVWPSLPQGISNSEALDGPNGSVEVHARDKRRRRCKVLEEEMSWNAGLQHWMAQRDAWTGGRRRSVRRSAQSLFLPAQLAKDRSFSVSTFPPAFAGCSISRSSPSSVDIIEEVPISPPFLSVSTHLRESMTPQIQSQMYSTVVLRSMTPLAPINLADMTSAMVAGWKADGQWPPSPTLEEPLRLKQSLANPEQLPQRQQPQSGFQQVPSANRTSRSSPIERRPVCAASMFLSEQRTATKGNVQGLEKDGKAYERRIGGFTDKMPYLPSRQNALKEELEQQQRLALVCPARRPSPTEKRHTAVVSKHVVKLLVSTKDGLGNRREELTGVDKQRPYEPTSNWPERRLMTAEEHHSLMQQLNSPHPRQPHRFLDKKYDNAATTHTTNQRLGPRNGQKEVEEAVTENNYEQVTTF